MAIGAISQLSRIESSQEAQEVMNGFYDHMYKKRNERHDSPDHSRVHMARSVREYVRENGGRKNILNIGSGAQAVEKEILANPTREKKLLDTCRFFTLDIAVIEARQLLARKFHNVLHLRADAMKLPFRENTFDLLISNLAIDFLPHDVFAGVHRVLKPDGKIIFNFHPAGLTEGKEKLRDPQVRLFWDYLDESQHLFQTPDQIEKTLQSYGFLLEHISDRGEWWHVRGTKNPRSDESFSSELLK